MVLFTIKGKEKEYPYIVLKGKNFYLKAQELIVGKNTFREFPTLDEDIKDLEIKIIDIDIEPQEINRIVGKYFSENDTVNSFHPIFKNTIDKNYEALEMEQSAALYDNMCSAYTEDKLKEIIYTAIYKNVSKNWLVEYFSIDKNDIDFILNYLPAYYNFLGINKKIDK